MLKRSVIALVFSLMISACSGLKGDFGYRSDSPSVIVGPSPSVYLKSGEVDLWNKADYSKQMVANALSKCAGFSECLIQAGFTLTNDADILKRHADELCFARSFQSMRPSLDFCLESKTMRAYISPFEKNVEQKSTAWEWDKAGVNFRTRGVDYAVCGIWETKEVRIAGREYIGETQSDKDVNCLLKKGYIFKGKVDGYNRGMGVEANCYSVWFYSQYQEYCESSENPVRPRGGFKNWHMLYGTCKKYPQRDVCQLLTPFNSKATGETNNSQKPRSTSYALPDQNIERARQLQQDMQNQSNSQMNSMLRNTAPKNSR
jgi:hypothetical protein